MKNILSPSFGSLRAVGHDVWRLLKRGISARIEDERNIVVQLKVPQAERTEAAAEQTLDMKFPGVWLRDNCSCADCFHASSKSRRIDWTSFDANVRPLTLQTDAATQQLRVTWTDRHESTYALDWLRARDFSAKRREAYLNSFYRPKPIHWRGAEFDTIMTKFDYEKVMTDDAVLHDWLEALAVRGVALIRKAPIEQSVVRQLADRVGFIRRTTYGEEYIVQAKPGAKNYAYLSAPLPLHTDLPYYEYKPSVTILHCMTQTQSQGGQNLLVDAYHIVERLRAERPQDFKILTQTLVDWNDIGSDGGQSFHNIWRDPVICLDAAGACARINHSIPQRDSHFSVPLEQVQPWYEAYARFVSMASADAHTFKTQTGDVLTFNNLRLLHGRTGYDDTDQNLRVIVGGYLDWDIIYSRLRVLKTSAERS